MNFKKQKSVTRGFVYSDLQLETVLIFVHCIIYNMLCFMNMFCISCKLVMLIILYLHISLREQVS